MKRLILTTSDSGAGGLRGAKLADCVIPFGLRFVWGELRSEVHLDTWLSARSAKHEGSHWLDGTSWWLKEARAGEGLIEFCERFDELALWVDPDPNSQLTLIWLLDYLRRQANPKRTSRSRQQGLAGLSPADAAALVQPPQRGPQRPAPASVQRAGTARRTSDARDRAWRHGNAAAGTDIVGRRGPVRCFSWSQKAQ
jgi:hypothetical protein